MAKMRLVIGFLIAAIMLGPIILGLIFYVAGGLQEELAASVVEEDGVLKISTFYYDVHIRLEGGTITYLNLRGPQGELATFDSQSGIYGLLLAVGKARLVDAGLEWRVASINRLDDGSQVAILTAEWEGVELRARLTAYGWAPLLSLEITAVNRSDAPVTLVSSVGGPMTVLSYAGDATWRAAATVEREGVPTIVELNLESGATVREKLYSALLVAEVNEDPRFFYGFRANGRPLNEVYYSDAYPFSGDKSGPVLAFGPGRLEVTPGRETLVASFDLALGYFNIHNLSIAGLLGEAAILYPDLLGKAKDYYPYDAKIDELQKRVDTLQQNLDTVIKERDDLRRQVRELQGKDQLLQDKISELEARVKALEEQNRVSRLLAPLAFIAGVVGGGVAAFLALRRG